MHTPQSSFTIIFLANIIIGLKSLLCNYLFILGFLLLTSCMSNKKVDINGTNDLLIIEKATLNTGVNTVILNGYLINYQGRFNRLLSIKSSESFTSDNIEVRKNFKTSIYFEKTRDPRLYKATFVVYLDLKDNTEKVLQLYIPALSFKCALPYIKEGGEFTLGPEIFDQISDEGQNSGPGLIYK